MGTINFDHSKETLDESLEISREQFAAFQATLLDITKDVIDKDLKESEIAEQLAKLITYKELLYLATHAVDILARAKNIKSLIKL